MLPFDTEASRGPASAARVDFPGRGGFENTGPRPPGSECLDPQRRRNRRRLRQWPPGGAQGADGVGRLVGSDLKAALADVDRLLSVAVLTDDDVERKTGSRSPQPPRPTSTARSHGSRYTSETVPTGRGATGSSSSARRCDLCGPPGPARFIG